MYYLKLKKETRYVERCVGSNSILLDVNEYVPHNLLIPIVLDGIQISEAKVVDSQIFGPSTIKIILSDSNSIVPTFELRHENVNYIKNNIPLFDSINDDKPKILDIRPVNINMLKTLTNDTSDYNGLSNLKLNVRFMRGGLQYGYE